MQKTAEVLRAAADLFEERNKTYKNTTEQCGKILNDLFPNGITLKKWEDYERFHILVLIVVKLVRYGNNWEEGGHPDSIFDQTVYSAMLAAIDAEQGNAERTKEET